MPRGVYPRTANQLKAAKANLAKGREPAARAKAAVSLREIAQDPAWRERVSRGTQAAMWRPEVREKHLAALREALTLHGVNFKGGNGCAPVPLAQEMEKVLAPLGFRREHVVLTRGHGTAHRPPAGYKVDFGHPDLKIAVELDGPCHRPMARRKLDQKKNEVLQALGWSVHRVNHAAGS